MPDVRMPDGAVVRFPDDMPKEQIRALIERKFPEARPVGTGEDVLKSIGSGLASGAMGVAGLPGDLNRLGAAAAGKVSSLLFGERSPEKQAAFEKFKADNSGLAPTPPTPEAIQSATGFTPYEPKTMAGKYARTGAEFVPGAVAFGAPRSVAEAMAAAIKTGIVPGVASEAAGQLAENSGNAKFENAARIGGALVGGIAGGSASRLVTPFRAPAARRAAADVLRREGVELTAGQRVGAKSLQNMESEIGGGAVASQLERQGEQFTAAALRRVGENANRASPEVIDHAFTRIGGEFDRLAVNNNMRFDRRLTQSLGRAVTDYTTIVPPSQQAPIVGQIVGDIATSMQNNTAMPGRVYQALRSRLGKAAQSARISDPQLAQALRDIQEAVDSAMQRSLRSSADIQAWQTARRQYRNLLVIEKAATGAGETAASGIISPAQLRAAAVGQSRRGYARGRGDFDELARAGVGTMTPLPQSGTPGRLAARVLPAAIGSLIGGGLGGADGLTMGTVAGALAPTIAGRALMTRPVQAYLGNGLLAPGTTPRWGNPILYNALAAPRDRKLLPGQSP